MQGALRSRRGGPSERADRDYPSQTVGDSVPAPFSGLQYRAPAGSWPFAAGGM